MSTHYSLAHKTRDLRNQAKIWAVALIQKCKARSNKTRKIPILCYAGMSGTSAATALSLALLEIDPNFVFKMCYVRKKNEKSHGNNIEHDLEEHQDWSKTFLVFVDDFISSGDSRKFVVKAANEKFTEMENWRPDICEWVKSNFVPLPKNKNVPTIEINYTPERNPEWFE